MDSSSIPRGVFVTALCASVLAHEVGALGHGMCRVHGEICPVGALPPEHGPERHPAAVTAPAESTEAAVGPDAISWINNRREPVTWVNDLGQAVTWVASQTGHPLAEIAAARTLKVGAPSDSRPA
jgi:hypothetical protein